MTIEVPAEVLLTLNLTDGKLQREIRQALAVQFYLQERITTGQAHIPTNVFEGQLDELFSLFQVLWLENGLLQVSRAKMAYLRDVSGMVR